MQKKEPRGSDANSEAFDANDIVLDANEDEFCWIRTFAVVAFDVDSGHKLEFEMPTNSMDDDERNRLRMTAMPDCNTNQLGDCFYCFRHRRSHGLPLFSSSVSDQSFDYCYALFRQQKNEFCARGFFQKSVVLISHFPFVNLFERIIKVIGPLYFEYGYVVFEAALANIKGWPFPQPDSHLSLPFMGETIYFNVPNIHVIKQSSIHKLHTRSFQRDKDQQRVRKRKESEKCLKNFINRVSNETSKFPSSLASAQDVKKGRNAVQRISTEKYDERLEQSQFPTPISALTSRGGGPVEGCYFNNFDESSSGISEAAERKNGSSMSEYSECEDVQDESDIDFSNIPNKLDGNTRKLKTIDSVGMEGRSPFAEMLLADEAMRRKKQGLFQSMGLYSACGKHLVEYLWVMWEIAITGSPVLVVGPNVGSSSAVILSIVSLISPIFFGGDFRPHFTTFDPDYLEVTHLNESMRAKFTSKSNSDNYLEDIYSNIPSILLGTINPIFLKSLSHWPNAIILPEVPGRQSHDAKKRRKYFSNGKNDIQQDQKNNAANERNIFIQSYFSGLTVIRTRKRGNISVAPATVSLDSYVFESKVPADYPIFICRKQPVMTPNFEILSQLLDPHPSYYSNHKGARQGESVKQWQDGVRAINDVILRRHFENITKEFLSKFSDYLKPIIVSTAEDEKNNIGSRVQRLSIYTNAEHLFKRFDRAEFLRNLEPPPCLSHMDWKTLYSKFLNTHNFRMWFLNERRERMKEVKDVCRAICLQTSPSEVIKMCVPIGKDHAVKAQLRNLLKEVKMAIKREYSDEKLVQQMKSHEMAIERAIKKAEL